MNPTVRAALLALLLAACSGDGQLQRAAPADTALAVDAGPPPPLSAALLAGDSAGRGQLVYVPVYSQIYYRDARRVIGLAVTLSVRNTDPERAIDITQVRYYDSAGRLLHSYVRQPVRLGPMASKEYVLGERDARGGAGANFLVEWTAAEPVTEPVVEAVMVSTYSGQGISFTSTGRPLRRR